MIKHIISFLLIFLFTSMALSQDYVFTIKKEADAVRFKVIPGSLESFEAYKYGKLEATVSFESSNGKVKSDLVYVLKPAAISSWESSAKGNPQVRVANELLRKTKGNIPPVTLQEMVDHNKALTNVHWLYSMATCLDPEASKLSGLEFKIPQSDSLFTISLRSTGSNKIDTSWTFNVNNIYNYENSPDITCIPGEHTVKVIWSHEYFQKQAVAYIVEKRKGKAPFESFGPPIGYSTSRTDRGPSEFFIEKLDSTLENYIDYDYRVIAIDGFGDKLNPSKVVTTHSIDLTPPLTPENIKLDFIDGRPKITWNSPADDVDKIIVVRSDVGEGGPYEPCHEGYLSNKDSEFWDDLDDPRATYHYMLLAADTAKNVTKSHPKFLHKPDDYPPETPKDFSAIVDSMGLVTLYWHHSTDSDLQGYKVFRTDDLDQEFIKISKENTTTNVLYDQLNLKKHNPISYYYVAAVDKVNNHSITSDTLIVMRPDIIAPSAPILRRVVIVNDKVNLAWIPSSSKDVSHYLIMADTGSGWWEQSRCAADTNQFSVPLLSDQTVISYKITAEDEMGNRSSKEAGKRVYIDKTKDEELLFELSNSDGAVSISWGEITSSKSIMVYRSSDGEKFSMLRRINGNILSFKDKTVKKGERYQYKIIKENDNGTRSAMSLAQEIKVK